MQELFISSISLQACKINLQKSQKELEELRTLYKATNQELQSLKLLLSSAAKTIKTVIEVGTSVTVV